MIMLCDCTGQSWEPVNAEVNEEMLAFLQYSKMLRNQP